MPSLRRNHKSSATTCSCSKCGALNRSTPPDHPHRNCSTVENGVVHLFRSSMNRGTWRRISPDDYAKALDEQKKEHTRGPTEDEETEADILRAESAEELPFAFAA